MTERVVSSLPFFQATVSVSLLACPASEPSTRPPVPTHRAPFVQVLQRFQSCALVLSVHSPALWQCPGQREVRGLVVPARATGRKDHPVVGCRRSQMSCRMSRRVIVAGVAQLPYIGIRAPSRPFTSNPDDLENGPDHSPPRANPLSDLSKKRGFTERKRRSKAKTS